MKISHIDRPNYKIICPSCSFVNYVTFPKGADISCSCGLFITNEMLNLKAVNNDILITLTDPQ